MVSLDDRIEKSINTRHKLYRTLTKKLKGPLSLEKLLRLLVTDDLLDEINRNDHSLCDFFLFREYLHTTFFSETLTSSKFLQQLADLVGEWRIVVPDDLMFSLPLNTSFELDQLELVLSNNPTMKVEFSDRLSKIFNADGKQLSLANQMTKLVTSDLILQFNWQGKHHKKNLSQYNHVFRDCFKWAAECTEDVFEKEIKKVIRTLHNREHITNSRKRKSQRTSEYNMVEYEEVNEIS